MTSGELKINIKGMHCASCAQNIEKKLFNTPGVINAKVNYATENGIVEYNEKEISPKEILDTINKLGYNAYLNPVDSSSDMVTDPICGMRISKKSAIKKEYEGKTYYFCSEECVRKFESPERELKSMKRRVAIVLSGALLLGILRVIAMFTLTAGVSIVTWVPFPQLPYFTWGVWLFLITTPIQFIGGWTFYKGAYNALKNRSLNMDFLIAMGTLTAYFYSVFIVFFPKILPVSESNVYFEVSAVIIAFVLLGKFMEDYIKRRTFVAVRKLLDLRPKKAHVIRGGKEIEILAEEIMAGEIVIVKPGEKIPVDGEVISGETYIDESMVTGESTPVLKKEGSEVIGATYNKHGMIKFKATKVGSETTLMQIVKMVEEAQSSSAPIQRIADNVSSYFVPAVIVIAVFSFISWWLLGNFTLGLLSFVAVLIISCPCALGIATPAALMVGVGKGAEAGILIRGGEYLEKAYRLKKIVFDKTGTLTRGEPSVTDIISVNSKPSFAPTGLRTGRQLTVNRKEVLFYAASVEKFSEHPLAEAIVKRADEEKIKLGEVENFKAITGKGVFGMVNKEEILVGNRKLMEENEISVKNFENYLERLEKEGKTVVILAVSKKAIGLLAITDPLKENSTQAVKELQNLGIDVVMLTGDNERTAQKIAREAGIKNVIANVLPQDKLDVIKKLQSDKSVVAMVGDGINDAPALAQADIGIAIGSGSDVAKETGGIILVKDDLRDVVMSIKLSKKTMQKIKQNLFWALFYNSVAIPVAAFGLLNPIIAAAAMALSSLSVVLNSALLKRFKLENS